MKRFIAGLVCLLVFSNAFSRTDSTLPPPYLRFPTVPPLKLLLTDSATVFTKEDLKKGKAVLVVIFNPDCDHCQHETEEIKKHIDEFKDAQIIMASMSPLSKIKAFAEQYDLASMPNIVVGQDTYFILAPFYNMHNMPFNAAYNKKGDLIEVFSGSVPVERLINALKQKK